MSTFLNRKRGWLVEKKLWIYEGLGQNTSGWFYRRKNYYVNVFFVPTRPWKFEIAQLAVF